MKRIFSSKIYEYDKIITHTNEELDVVGFLESKKKIAVTIILGIFTFGFLFFLMAFKPKMRLYLTHDHVPLSQATTLLIKEKYQGEEFIYEEHVIREENSQFFLHKKLKYIWDIGIGAFCRTRYPKERTTITDLKSQSENGLSCEEVKLRRGIYGINKLYIDLGTFWKLVAFQAKSALFLSPTICIGVLCLKMMFKPHDAPIYGTVIVLLGVITLYIGSMIILILEINKWTKSLQEKMITEAIVKVIRNLEVTTARTSELVPGDLVILQSGTFIEGDMMIVDGSAIVNESSLTGESIPVTKIPTPTNDDLFDKERHRSHMLYSGTKILQVVGGSELKALVVNTGFDTLRGEMVRSILYPKPTSFSIYEDFVKLLVPFLITGTVMSLWAFIHWFGHPNVGFRGAMYRALDIIAFVIPPILPATIISINKYAKRHLKKCDVKCISSNSIPLAGTVDVICFDKTGTLTEDDINVHGILPVVRGEFTSMVEDVTKLDKSSIITNSLVACHSLSCSSNGELSGNPIDINILKSFNWILVPLDDPCYNYYEMCPLFLARPNDDEDAVILEIAVMRIFPFDSKSDSKRATVVGTNRRISGFDVFSKGAPEVIIGLCRSESVPTNIWEVLQQNTSDGLRVLAYAYKHLAPNLTWKNVDSMSRDSLEENMAFGGLVLLQNKLKATTLSTISILNKAQLSLAMVTGDILSTAISISYQSGILQSHQKVIIVNATHIPSSVRAASHIRLTYKDFTEKKSEDDINVAEEFVLAIDGETFDLLEQYNKRMFQRVVHKCKIYGRMSPNQKMKAIKALQDLGHYVAMCGDGCNDCGALRTAHVGISVSSTSSVAASFVSSDISHIPNILRIGRVNLVSTCAAMKYSIVYCFSTVIAVVFLFSIYTEPTDVQYLIMELILVAVPCLTIGWIPPAANLSSDTPLKRLLHPFNIASIIFFLLIQCILYGCSWLLTTNQKFYSISETTAFSIQPTYEGTVIIQEMYFSLALAAFVFNFESDFRKPMYKNKILSGYYIGALILWIVCIFCSSQQFMDWMNFRRPHYNVGFILTIFFMTLAFSLISFITEHFLLNKYAKSKFSPVVEEYFKKPYKIIEEELENDSNWLKKNDGSEPQVDEYSDHEDEETTFISQNNDELSHEIVSSLQFLNEVKPLENTTQQSVSTFMKQS